MDTWTIGQSKVIRKNLALFFQEWTHGKSDSQKVISEKESSPLFSRMDTRTIGRSRGLDSFSAITFDRPIVLVSVHNSFSEITFDCPIVRVSVHKKRGLASFSEITFNCLIVHVSVQVLDLLLIGQRHM